MPQIACARLNFLSSGSLISAKSKFLVPFALQLALFSVKSTQSKSDGDCMTAKTPPPLGFAVSIVRQAAGLKQKDAALAAGMTASMLSKLESGDEPMSPERSGDLL